MRLNSAEFNVEWQLPNANTSTSLRLSVLKGTLKKVKHLKKLGLSLAVSAMLFGASDIASAQGRRGRGEERSQENQAEREQRQQQRQQQQQTNNQERQQRWEQ